MSPSKILDISKNWKVTRKLKDQQVSLEFKMTATEKNMVRFQPSLPDSVLVSYEIASWKGKEFLITLWQEGTHSTSVRVLDPESKGVVAFEMSSPDSIIYKRIGDGLEFHTMDLVDPKKEPLDKVTLWKAVTP